MPLKADGIKFIDNGIGIHNEACGDIELNDAVFQGNTVGYLEGKTPEIDSLFKAGAPQKDKAELLQELSSAINEGTPEKAESIFTKYKFHQWIAVGASIATIIGTISTIIK